MHRHKYLMILDGYMESWGEASYPGKRAREDEIAYLTIRDFITTRADGFERTCEPGHITGSALVVTSDLSRVLLTHHAKLDKWLQLGGHADGDPEIARVALREAEEESGLTDLRFFPQSDLFPDAEDVIPFDLDCHMIPARGDEPEHVHHDTRFVLLTDHPDSIQISDESHDLRWFTWEEARRVTEERSMLRQFDKMSWIIERLQ